MSIFKVWPACANDNTAWQDGERLKLFFERYANIRNRGNSFSNTPQTLSAVYRTCVHGDLINIETPLRTLWKERAGLLMAEQDFCPPWKRSRYRAPEMARR